ncbi:MAG: sigma 54-interacting transcriptional regulator [Candidatus Cloacimonetes bacterium]|nr:sigma 54-interacting transcriptional regulator [Candidatus Cloacimonadota bacterium]
MSLIHRAELINSFNLLSEENPPKALDLLKNYPIDQLSSEDLNLLKYFEAKSLFTMRQFEESELITLECLSMAISNRDYYILVKGNVLQGLCSQSLNIELNIRPCFEMAIEFAIESTDFELIIYASTFYMTFLYGKSLYPAAKEEEKRILDLIKRVEPSLTTITAFMQISRFNLELHSVDKAIKVLLQAFEHARILNFPSFQLSITNNLASLYMQIRDFAKAEELVVNGLRIAKELSALQQICLMLMNQGNLKIWQGEFTKAIGYFDECYTAVKECRGVSPMFLIDLFNNYSMSYASLGDNHKALEYIDKAIDLAVKSNLANDKVQMEESKTNILVSMEDFEQAKDLLKSSIKFYKKHKQYPHLLRASRSLATLYYNLGEYKNSFMAFSKLDEDTDNYIAQILSKQTEEDSGKPSLKDLNLESLTPNIVIGKPEQKYDFIGNSKACTKVLDSALRAAQHPNVNVLILGESGTGKEVIAQLVHKNSIRRHNSFVSVNVATISASLIESELFGHSRGAFTGAEAQTKGYFLQADKGTLFLDEIAEMPYEMQSKLLRVLETKKVMPLGSSKEINFDSRIICATNQDLREQLAHNKFRLDLFHRLNTIEITIPPLRERQEDIELLLHHFVNLFSQELKKAKPHLDKSLLDVLVNYSFPGNVRELKNIVERMFILCNTLQWNSVELCRINPFILSTSPCHPEQEVNEESRILKALIQAKGKQKDAARFLGMSEATLHRRVIKFNLQQHTRKMN